MEFLIAHPGAVPPETTAKVIAPVPEYPVATRSRGEPTGPLAGVTEMVCLPATTETFRDPVAESTSPSPSRSPLAATETTQAPALEYEKVWPAESTVHPAVLEPVMEYTIDE